MHKKLSFLSCLNKYVIRQIVTFNAKQRAENLGKSWQWLKFKVAFDAKMLKTTSIMKIMQSGTPEYIQYINN